METKIKDIANIDTYIHNELINLCDTNAVAKLSELIKDIEQGFKSLQIFRSEYLMRNSVLAMHPTIDGKYWQAMLERNVHFHELLRLSYDYKEKIADIEIMKAEIRKEEYKILKTKAKYDKDILIARNNKLKIKLDRANSELVYMKKEAEQRVREVLTWSKIIDELKPDLKYSPINPEEHQEEEWKVIYANHLVAMDMVKGQSDMQGAMNIITVANEIFRDEKKLVH